MYINNQNLYAIKFNNYISCCNHGNLLYILPNNIKLYLFQNNNKMSYTYTVLIVRKISIYTCYLLPNNIKTKYTVVLEEGKNTTYHY